MSTKHDPIATEAPCPSGGLPPVDPFRALHVHFGMLLGVDDFETAGAYHRGKMWMHTAWLHGAGVIWGLGVDFDAERGELRVRRGLAVDAAGRELYLDADACLDLARWYAEHAGEPGLDATRDCDGRVQFQAHVRVRFQTCLTRPVPALAEPCTGAGQTTAYSRMLETVALTLEPGEAEAAPPPYHRLRLLFGLARPRVDHHGSMVPEDEEVLRTLIHITTQCPVTERAAAARAAFQHFAALDAINLEPAADDTCGGGLFPAADPTSLVLAHLRVTLVPRCDELIVDSAEVSYAGRTTHVPTATLQDLVAAMVGTPAVPPPDAGGPRIDRASVHLEAHPCDPAAPVTIVLTANKPLHPASVKPTAIEISAFSPAEGWRVIPLCGDDIALDKDRKTLRLRVRVPPGFSVSLITLRGTGPAPLLGLDLIPLAGETGGAPATPHRGSDFIHVIRKGDQK